MSDIMPHQDSGLTCRSATLVSAGTISGEHQFAATKGPLTVNESQDNILSSRTSRVVLSILLSAILLPLSLPAGTGLPIAELMRETQVDFEKEILPTLKNNCLACHNTTKAKGGLNLETPQLILKGGDTGPAASPGKSAESLLFTAAAHLDSELIMPPKDNKANASDFSPEQLALLKLWIDQGAKGEVRAATPVNWLEKPPTLDPIFAVALTRDGQFAACGRGNRVDVYHIPSGQHVTRLADTRLADVSLTNAAHRDQVNSLAFNPDGALLASAGFREVKLWRRPRDVQQFAFNLSNTAGVFALSPDRKTLAYATADHGIALHELNSSRHKLTMLGHSNSIVALKFSPDGTKLLSGSTDKTVRVWNTSDGALISSNEIPTEATALAWLTNGAQIACAGGDGIIRLWNLSPVTLARELKGHTGSVSALDALPDGQHLLSGGADGTVRKWKLEDGSMVQEMKHDGEVTALAVRADGKRFASAGTNGIAKLWNAEDGKLVAEIKGDRYAYELVAETERAQTVAKATTAFHEKAVETAEAEKKKQTERVATATTTNTFSEKVFLEKEKGLKEAQVAKIDSEKALTNLLAEIQRVTESFESADKAGKDATLKAKATSDKATQAQLAAERAALSKSDAARIATDTANVAARAKAAIDNADAAKETARRIAEESAAVAEKSKGYAEAVIADAEMKTKLAAEARAAAEKAIEELASLSFAAGQLKPAYDKTLAEAPEKRKQATNAIETASKSLDGADKEFKRAETRKSVTGHELELALLAEERATNDVVSVKAVLENAVARQRKVDADLERFRKEAQATEQPIRTLSFSPDGRTLASTGDDGRIHTWSAEDCAAFEVFPSARAKAAQGTPGLLSFLNAQTILGSGKDGRIIAWDLNPAWTLERVIGTGDIDSPLKDRVNAVRFSPDGQTIATGGGDPTRSGDIKLWNAEDGKFLREFADVHSDAVLSLDFSPDGKYLASSSADRFVRVLDLETGKIVKAFEGHTSYVLDVAWKSDSRTLASAGADNVIKIWDFVTGQRKKNIDGAGKEVTSIAFVGTTDQAVATSGDNQVRLLKENGEKVRSFEGAVDFMNAVAATPDGGAVVAGGQDGVLRVWNGRDGKAVATFAPPRDK